MEATGFKGTIETVRGALDDARAAQILGFWAANTGLDEITARERLPQVVCLALGAGGEIVGVNSVFEEEVEPVGRRFWVYRAFLLEPAAASEMMNAAFDALEGEFDPSGDGPLGLCVRVNSADAQAAPEVIWPGSHLVYAGYDVHERQVRIRYFDDAQVGPGFPNSPTSQEMRDIVFELDERYRVVPLAESDDVTTDDVIAMWQREKAIPEEEARRRADEVQLVALERNEGVVGATTSYLQHNEQLRMTLWYYRGFVAAAHRESMLATFFAIDGRDYLSDRFASGEDTRGAGVLYEIENEGLRMYYNRGLWLPSRFGFIGENHRGSHVRVHWFPGAKAPVGGA